MTSRFEALGELLLLLEADPSLNELHRFRERIDALDRLDAYPVDEQFAPLDAASPQTLLYRKARLVQSNLEAANQRFYKTLRDDIRRGTGGKTLLAIASNSAGIEGVSCVTPGESYDHLDELVSGVLHFSEPEPTARALAAEMVAYQPTPARHIFDLLRRAPFTEQDVLVDLGSGLGHIPLLAAICKGIRSIGVELEPTFIRCAKQTAAELNLRNVEFVAQDARDMDLARGTIFYLYTPFRGAVLSAVLGALRGAAARRAIHVCTFGPCTPVVAVERWLTPVEPLQSGRVGIFRSRLSS